MSDSPVTEPVDESSLRELISGLMEKARELEARLALVEMRPTVFPGPHYPGPFQPPFVATWQHADPFLRPFGWTA